MHFRFAKIFKQYFVKCTYLHIHTYLYTNVHKVFNIQKFNKIYKVRITIIMTLEYLYISYIESCLYCTYVSIMYIFFSM